MEPSQTADLLVLAELFQSGMLTEAEFAAAKAKMLGLGTPPRAAVPPLQSAKVKLEPEPQSKSATQKGERGPKSSIDGPIVLDGHDYANILDELEGEDLLVCAREEHCAVPPGSPPAAVRSALKAHFQGLRELFAMVDADGSGGLDGEELGDLCSRLGIAMSADEVALALKEMDTDGDGTVDFREFNEWYKRVRGQRER